MAGCKTEGKVGCRKEVMECDRMEEVAGCRRGAKVGGRMEEEAGCRITEDKKGREAH